MATDSELETVGIIHSPAEHDSLVSGPESKESVTTQQLGVFQKILGKLGIVLDSDQQARYEQLELVAVEEDEEEEV